MTSATALASHDVLTGQAAAGPLVDPFGRHIDYIRVSVTDRCDFRCVYCMAETMQFLPRQDLLTLEELDRLCSAFVARGTTKIRLTGGEPLVRRDLMALVRGLSRHLASGALRELTLTTNGSQLQRYAAELADAGVRRVNVSIDSLDRDRFRTITRRGDLDVVLRGLDAAQAAGLKVKINTVALKGVNDFEIPSMIEWAHGRGMDLTLIEVMPLGEIGEHRIDQYLPLSQLRADLAGRWRLTDLAHKTSGPARYVKVEETGGRLGFIHAPHPQFLRELQPRARHLHRHALHVPWPGGRRRSAWGAARLARGRAARRGGSRRRSRASPRATISSSTASWRARRRPAHECHRRLSRLGLFANRPLPMHAAWCDVPPSSPPGSKDDVKLRVRKARSVSCARIQSLARTGAAGGLLTPREVKEVCQAVVAEGDGLPVARRAKTVDAP